MEPWDQLVIPHMLIFSPRDFSSTCHNGGELLQGLYLYRHMKYARVGGVYIQYDCSDIVFGLHTSEVAKAFEGNIARLVIQI